MALAAKTDWTYPGAGAGWPGNNLTKNNSSGFSALPGGYRNYYGSFLGQSNYGGWWSATEWDASYAYRRDLTYYYYYLGRTANDKSCGYSVRLVRDSN